MYNAALMHREGLKGFKRLHNYKIPAPLSELYSLFVAVFRHVRHGYPEEAGDVWRE